jgi:protein-S-isoprenylcysteine O-methyltransferase Ste14
MGPVHYIVYAIWWLSESLIARYFRSAPVDSRDKDKNTIKLLWAVIILSNAAAITAASIIPAAIYPGHFVSYTGLVLMVAGILCRLYAIRSLGKMFTVDVTIRQGHVLKNDGIYKYLRHPSYSGAFITFIGFGLSLNNWVSLPVEIIPIALAFGRRIRVEEAALTEAFGTSYREYKKSTYALIPFVY